MTKIRPAKERFMRDVWFYRELPAETVHVAAEKINRHAEVIGAVELSVPTLRAMAECLEHSTDPAALDVFGKLLLLAEQFEQLMKPSNKQAAPTAHETNRNH
ncbi:hypothetical protein [Pandoraea cepalis]|nr:hypothetical protein [Pandoraea cepalis]